MLNIAICCSDKLFLAYPRYTLLVQPRSHIKVNQREGDFAANLGAKCKLVPETFQVNAQCVGQNGYPRILQPIPQFLA